MFSDSMQVKINTPDFKISIGDYLANFDDTNKESYEQTTGDRDPTALGLKPYYEFSPISTYFSGTNVLSYSFSNTVSDIESQFSITIKEDTKTNSGEYFLDKVKELDVVQITENGESVFWGVIRTISFGATAGAFNKVITISGVSASSLLKMFKIHTDLSIIQSFVSDTSNSELTRRITNLFLNKKNTDGVDVMEIFRLVYLNFYYVSNGFVYKNKKWKKNNNRKVVASTKIQRLFNFIFGVVHDDNDGESYNLMKGAKLGHKKPVEFLNCDLKMKYQIARNLYNETECSVYSYFDEMFPRELYEFYCDLKTNTFYIREKPYAKDKWEGLTKTIINPALITDYTLTKTDTNIYTAFFSYPQGSTLDSSTFKVINSTGKNGNSVVQVVEELVELYGFIPFDCSITGYIPSKNKSVKTVDISKEYSTKLKEAYENLRDMYSGDVTFINLNDGTKKPTIGEKVELCNNEFYVTEEQHSWSYNGPCKINLKLERGGKYKDGEFCKNEKQNLSKTWAELLEKE